jgi:hypothetical protein
MPRSRWWLVPALLCLFVFSAPAAAPPAKDTVPAPEAQLQEGKDTIEITGVAAPRWKLVYGKATYVPKEWHPLLAQASGHRAWYAYGSWLRLLDTQKGTVLGRWQFSYPIVKLAPEDGRVTVETEFRDAYRADLPIYHLSERLDPAAPKLTPLTAENLMQFRQGENEVYSAFFPKGVDLKYVKPEELKAALPGLEEQMRRDPLSPWYRLYYWKALEDIQDKRAATVIPGVAPSTAGTNYSELLAASALLTRWGNHYAASLYFEAGYRDFLARNEDPRLLTTVLNRLIVYNPLRYDQTLPAAEQQAVIERIYRLAPYGEFSFAAWDELAKRAAKEGRPTDAALWQVRARRAEAASPVWNFRFLSRTDRSLMSEVAALLALIACFLVFGAHYSQQHRAELAAKQPRPGFFGRLSFFNVKYWTRGQRFGFVLLAVLFWLLVGYGRTRTATILRSAEAPLATFSGSLAGARTRDYFASLPASPERDLLIAVSDQHSGEAAKAEVEYRLLPQFAESWNNLGALLAATGKSEDAKQAYEHALQVKPGFPEALHNLGRPVKDEWIQVHDQYLPNQPILAVPTGAQFRTAFSGSREFRIKQTLKGPLGEGEGLLKLLGGIEDTPGPLLEIPTGTGADVVYLLLLLASLALLVRRPRTVSRPGGKISAVFEMLFPGTNPRWGLLGGLATLTWLYLVIQAVLIYMFNTPYVLEGIAFPNTVRVYGVPADGMAMLVALGPSKLVAYGLPALLFLVNLGIVVGQRRSGMRPTSMAATGR